MEKPRSAIALLLEARVQPLAECCRGLDGGEIARNEQGATNPRVLLRAGFTELPVKGHRVEVHATQGVVDIRCVLAPELPTVHWGQTW